MGTSKGLRAVRIHYEFVAAHTIIYQSVMEDVISGMNSGAVRDLYAELPTLLDKGDRYIKLLETEDPTLYNYYLSNAIMDLLFVAAPAIEV